MSILKKTIFLLSIGIIVSLGLYSCSVTYGTCDETTDSPISIIDVLDVKQIARNSNGYIYELDSTRVDVQSYKGFVIKFETHRLAYQNSFDKPFSIFSSAYALSCSESTVYLKEVYPKSIKIYTVYDLYRNVDVGSLVNRYFSLPFPTQNDNETEFVLSEVVRERFDDDIDFPFELEFYLYPSPQRSYGVAKFRIELELNNGEIFDIETPNVLFK
ncbi:hypothetical protein ACE193_22665 [Bernardetia sp. OM2101]|uniref:hypothetical protein n=1 Tax=Bernardetia sp. OM2101 TaxID=3344876 RepID=UPI0035CF2DFE